MHKFLFYLMILLYVAAGVNHFINPQFYLKIMPPYLPYHKGCVFLSGVCEIAFAVLLLFKSTKKIAAYLIIAMLLVFFTVHIQMLIDNWNKTGIIFWVAVIRLPLQFVFIYWAYTYSKANKN